MNRKGADTHGNRNLADTALWEMLDHLVKTDSHRS